MFLLVNVFSNPRFFGAHHVIELVAGFPNHRFFSINSQNCDQGIILKAKRRLFQLRKKNPIWMGLEKKLGEGLFSNDQGLGFFEDHGKASIQILVTFDFFLVTSTH